MEDEGGLEERFCCARDGLLGTLCECAELAEVSSRGWRGDASCGRCWLSYFIEQLDFKPVHSHVLRTHTHVRTTNTFSTHIHTDTLTGAEALPLMRPVNFPWKACNKISLFAHTPM